MYLLCFQKKLTTLLNYSITISQTPPIRTHLFLTLLYLTHLQDNQNTITQRGKKYTVLLKPFYFSFFLPLKNQHELKY